MLQFLCRLVVSQQYPLCLALRLKPQAEGRAAHGGSARRGRREESSAGARRRRGAPLPIPLMGVGRERAELSASCPAHAASAPRTQLADAVEEWSPPPRRSTLCLCWGVATEPDSTNTNCTWITPQQAPGQSPRTPSERWTRRHGEERGDGAKGVPLERKTRTLRIPARYGLWQICAPRQNPHVLPPGLGSTHPKGGSIGLGYLVIREGGARKR